MYIFDTNVFRTLGHYYPSRFPTIWERIDRLVREGRLLSVREVRNELEYVSASDHVNAWVKSNRRVFRPASPKECRMVAEIFQKEQYRGLVRRKNILNGWPVADPFIIAAAKAHPDGCVVTQESNKSNGARIPTVCDELKVKWLNLEGFLEEQGLKY